MDPTCLPTCNLYQPQCETGEICYRLTFANSNSLIFESQGPIGVCFRQQAGFRGPRESCLRDPMGGSSNCSPNLQCVPENASTSLCRTYCNPLISGGCVPPEKCVAFPGDQNGRRYGLCLPDTGFGTPCTRDGQCPSTLTCQVYDDPSNFPEEVSNICQFNLGAGLGLSPCALRTLTDGGVVPADLSCRSGACRGDPLSLNSTPYFCYASCAEDADCSIGGRTGYCDATFGFTTAFGTFGSVRGCRPGCADESSCAAYDAGVTCRMRLISSATAPSFNGTCSPVTGQLRNGERCSFPGQCRSNFCQLDDARGVRREGVCSEPCTTTSQCVVSATDGGVDGGVFSSIECLPLTVLASRGSDFVVNTPDDRLVQRALCTGARCTSNADCAGNGSFSAVCAPMVEPSGAAPVTMRCQARTAGVRTAGQTCVQDSECSSGVCGRLQAPSMGTGSMCFEACVGGSTCPGTTTCRVAGMQVTTTRGPVNLDSCAP
jgi:hypothetical protein